MPIRLKRILIYLAAAAAFLVLSAAYAYSSRYYPPNCDLVNPMLQAQDVLRGNWLMAHWHLTTVSYYTIDVPLFVLALLVLPFKTGTIHNVYGVVYAVVLVLALWLAGRRPGRKRLDLLGMAATFAILGFPTQIYGFFALIGPDHMATLLWVFPALIALDFPPNATGAARSAAAPAAWRALPAGRLVAALLFLTLALIGDTTTLYFVLVPLALVSVLRLRRRQGSAAEELAILGVCAGAELLTKLFERLVAVLHGYQMPPEAVNQNAAFIDFDHLADNIHYTIGGILRLFNADFFGLPPCRALIAVLICVLGMCVVLACVARGLSDIARSQKSGGSSILNDRIVAFLAIGVLIDIAFYASSNLVFGYMALRYLVPVVIYGGILVGRYGVDIWRSLPDQVVRREIAAAFLAWGVVSVYCFVNRILRIPLPSPTSPAQLGDWLRNHHLTYGYASYWATTAVTVDSQGAVQSCPVILKPSGRLGPYLWAADDRWYHGTPAHFLVIENPPYSGVDIKAAEKTFGQEAARYSVAGYTVLVWHKDITPLLEHE